MWLEKFADLAAVQDPLWQQAAAGLQPTTVPSGATLFECGDACQNYLFVLAGSVKIVSLNPDGREVVLYRVGAGQTCILTTSCLLGETDYPAQGITEQETTAMVMPRPVFKRLLEGSDGFRRFVFGQISDRMARLMGLVQELAFERAHVRLARTLLATRGDDQVVHATHAELAVELGTVREVVSRLLKEFEHNGWVALFRGGVRITDPEALKNHL